MGISKRTFKTSKLKTIFFFLVLAILFWALTKFSREYTATMDTTIVYTNLPEATLLAQNNAKEISFDLTANGFEFLMYKLKKPSVTIDVSNYYSAEPQRVTISEKDLVKLITMQLDKNIAAKNLSINEMKIELDVMLSKKVAVKAKTEFLFKKGFKALDSVKIIPDSVIISGPSHSIDMIHFVETELVSVKNIAENILEETTIIATPNIATAPETIQLELLVNEFTQTELTIPIEVLNLPLTTSIKLIPEVITIRFDISVAAFSALSEKDFKMVCDYTKRNTEENFMTPRLVHAPVGVVHPEFDIKKVEYLIFK